MTLTSESETGTAGLLPPAEKSPLLKAGFGVLCFKVNEAEPKVRRLRGDRGPELTLVDMAKDNSTNTARSFEASTEQSQK